MKMTMALNCPIFTITATSMSSIMGRNLILKENQILILYFGLQDILSYDQMKHYSLYAFAHYLVLSLVRLDPGQLVFITKKGVYNLKIALRYFFFNLIHL